MEKSTGLSVLLAAGIVLPIGFGLWRAGSLTKALLSDLRVLRILHYVALTGLGWVLYQRAGVAATQALPWPSLATILTFALLALCLTYAAIAAIITNNLADLAADKISNPTRPLVRGSVAPRPYLMAAIWCQAVALVLSAAVDMRMFGGILGVSLGYYVYSCRPLRLKRVPLISKALIGLNSWIVAVCGFALAGGDWLQFPVWWSVWILGPMSLAANFVDLKDIQGDGATGVWTLPVLLGEVRSRMVIALATLLGYGMAAYLLWGISSPWSLPLNIGAALCHTLLLFRKPYDERWVFLLYVGALFGLNFLLFFGRTLIP
jgi:4-hydroxybenzoate polyprenyltransferase